MQQTASQTTEGLTHEDFIEQAHSLVPLLREKAREAEAARRPLDEVIDAVDGDLFDLCRPFDLNTFEMTDHYDLQKMIYW